MGEYGFADAHHFRIQDRGIALNDAGVLQCSYSPPASRRRQSNLLRQVLIAHPAIDLKRNQYGVIPTIMKDSPCFMSIAARFFRYYRLNQRKRKLYARTSA